MSAPKQSNKTRFLANPIVHPETGEELKVNGVKFKALVEKYEQPYINSPISGNKLAVGKVGWKNLIKGGYTAEELIKGVKSYKIGEITYREEKLQKMIDFYYKHHSKEEEEEAERLEMEKRKEEMENKKKKATTSKSASSKTSEEDVKVEEKPKKKEVVKVEEKKSKKKEEVVKVEEKKSKKKDKKKEEEKPKKKKEEVVKVEEKKSKKKDEESEDDVDVETCDPFAKEPKHKKLVIEESKVNVEKCDPFEEKKNKSDESEKEKVKRDQSVALVVANKLVDHVTKGNFDEFYSKNVTPSNMDWLPKKIKKDMKANDAESEVLFKITHHKKKKTVDYEVTFGFIGDEDNEITLASGKDDFVAFLTTLLEKHPETVLTDGDDKTFTYEELKNKKVSKNVKAFFPEWDSKEPYIPMALRKEYMAMNK